jgi:hypothetical protein
VVNRASLKTRHARVNQLIAAMREIAGRGAAEGETSEYRKTGRGAAVAGGGAAGGEPPISKIETSEYKNK